MFICLFVCLFACLLACLLAAAGYQATFVKLAFAGREEHDPFAAIQNPRVMLAIQLQVSEKHFINNKKINDQEGSFADTLSFCLFSDCLCINARPAQEPHSAFGILISSAVPAGWPWPFFCCCCCCCWLCACAIPFFLSLTQAFLRALSISCAYFFGDEQEAGIPELP